MPTDAPPASHRPATPGPPSPAAIDDAIARHESLTRPRLDLLWSYYRNPMLAPADAPGRSPPRAAGPQRRVRLAQERGLPDRLSGARAVADDDRLASSREIVIENDIAWRIHTMVDFMFGRPVMIASTAPDPALRRTIDRVLDAVLESSGGVALLADVGLLGHVYGHVDLLVRADLSPADRAPEPPESDEALLALARRIRIEPIEPTRGVPILDPADYRRLTAYAIRAPRADSPTAPPSSHTPEARGLSRWLARPLAAILPGPRDRGPIVTEVFTAASRRVLVQDAPDAAPRTVSESPALVREPAPDEPADAHAPPIVHIQNISQPFRYAGLSEVEPLIPLQNELNTRLSDRASRVTLQSFKMYLARGLDGVERLTVGPGQVWSTDNPTASIEAFGGDGASPSEEAHILEVREALDKASGVPPLASGVVRAKIGNLTSENALRVTLMGLLSKTARKRVTYGRGLAEACRLVLLALDRAGALHTRPADRDVRIEWPDPLPRPERDTLEAAIKKIEIGVPRERVLGELGYAPTDPGIV